MKLSVAYNFEPGIIERLGQYSEVREIYGKLDKDVIGGGRSTYTLPYTSRYQLTESIKEAHRHRISFNYLLNGATLDGCEQTRTGQRRIRKLLDFLAVSDVDAVTVASPLLLQLIKARYPRIKTRVSVFAVVDTVEKARRWEEMGADTICVSATACNRNFSMLWAIRRAITSELQLLANASCLPHCPYELTHMQLLTRSSRHGDKLHGFCLDYCFLHCSARRLRDPVYYPNSTWIRPEDLRYYEEIGYDSFKLVERSCPGDLLLRRVAAYVRRSFSGNLLELVAPVAQLKKQQGASWRRRSRVILLNLRPHLIKLSSLRLMKAYAEQILLHDYHQDSCPVFIANDSLDGFLEGLLRKNCAKADCQQCGYCATWMTRTVRVDPEYQRRMLRLADQIEEGFRTGGHWFNRCEPAAGPVG